MNVDHKYLCPNIHVCVGGTKSNGGDVNASVWHIGHKPVKLCDIRFQLKRGHSVCEVDYGFTCAITGGQDSDLCVMYDAFKQKWKELKPMEIKKHRHGSVCMRERLYIFGGVCGQSKTRTVEYLNMSDETWHTGPAIPVKVAMPKTAVIDSRVYLLAKERLFCLDTDTNIWIELAPLPVSSWHGVSMTSARGCIYVAGGKGRIFYRYNPAKGSWTRGKQPQYCHKYGALVYHHPYLTLFGGKFMKDGTDQVESYYLGSFYDPEDKRWKDQEKREEVIVSEGPSDGNVIRDVVEIPLVLVPEKDLDPEDGTPFWSRSSYALPVSLSYHFVCIITDIFPNDKMEGAPSFSLGESMHPEVENPKDATPPDG